MAVLKRGDNTERLRLDAENRRFSGSFALAWRIWVRHFGAFLRLLWLPCLICGIICSAWWAVRSSFFFFGIDFREIGIDIIFGAMLLYVFSMMRNAQADYISAMEQGEEQNRVDFGGKRVGFWRNVVKIAKMSVRTWLPLVAVWIIAYLLCYLPLALEVKSYVFLPCAVVALFILPPVAGIVQSYLETAHDMPLLRGMKNGFGLVRRYYGVMAILWAIAVLFLLEASIVFLFGEAILEYAFLNRQRATVQEEVIDLPTWLPVLRYGLIVVCIGLLAFASVVWSLPQQVHIRSILHKETLRKKEKSTNPNEITIT